MGVQSSAGTKGNTYVTFDVVDPYGSLMAGGNGSEVMVFNVWHAALVASVTSHFHGWSEQRV